SAGNIPNLTFAPNTNVTSQGSFQFQVTDTLANTTSASAATMTIKIRTTSCRERLASAISGTEDHNYSFKIADFGDADTNDASTDPLASITITTLPTTGTLKRSGSAVTAGQAISAGNIPNLTFVPNTDVTSQGSFQFQVTDTLTNTTSASAATMTI